MNSNGQISRRSLKTNHQYPDVVQGLGDGIKNYVVSIVKTSVESYCLSPGKVCVAGPPGPKGIEGSRGERGPKGNTGIKGQKGVLLFSHVSSAYQTTKVFTNRSFSQHLELLPPVKS